MLELDYKIANVLPVSLREYLGKKRYSQITEIRLRLHLPVIIYDSYGEHIENIIMTDAMMRECLEYMADFSLYAHEDEISQGYITLKGGHRIGVCGKVYMSSGKVRIKDITSVNIRVGREIALDKRIGNVVMNGKRIYNTIIVSPPGCGKTTMLKGLIRYISANGQGISIAVVDERGELSGGSLGIRTDILSYSEKAYGINLMIRSMKPDVIAVDEIGSSEDIGAISYAKCSGTSIIATIHADTYGNVMKKLPDSLFERMIFLDGLGPPGKVRCIKDGEGKDICLDY